MSHFQDLTRRLLAAGSAVTLDGKSTHLLYTDSSSLISKEWTGKSFASEMLVAESVRPKSTASYVLTPDVELIVYISSSSRINITRYDDDGDEWLEDEITHHRVHPDGKVAASFGEDGRVLVFFQDPSNRLVYWSPNGSSTTHIPGQPLAGSPLSTAVVKGKVYVFYVSAGDHCMHYVTENNGRWIDEVWSKHAFEGKAEQFIVTPVLQSETPKLEAYVLTDKKALLEVTAEGELKTLGRVDEAGKFVSERSVDLCCIDAWENTLTEERLGSHLANDPSAIDSIGGPQSVTPLASACWKGNLDAVRLLLDNPYRLADPNALSPGNCTPLYYAICRAQACRKEMVSALLDAGARIDACYAEDNFNTPLMNAVADAVDKDVIHELVDRGASLTVKNGQGQTAVVLAEGSGMELELRPLKERNLKPHSIQKELIDFLVALVMLIVAYTNSDFVKNIVSHIVTELHDPSEIGDETSDES